VTNPVPPTDGFDVRRYTRGLERSPEGYWEAAHQTSVSYPDDGNAACAEVEDRSFWFRHRNRVIAAALERFPPPAPPLFDLGGGNGYVALALAAAGREVVVLEPGRAGARAAVSRGLRNVVCATVEAAGLRPGSVPAAGLFDVVEHVADDTSFLRAIRAALRPDGRLYLTVPAFQWLWSAEDDHAGHYRRYTLVTLRAALKAAGFKVEYASYFFAALAPAVLALRTVPTALGVRRSPTAASLRREHGTGSPAATGAAAALLDFEVARVRRGSRVPFGTSVLCVARPA
jgi:SAM-dependent methyltransferase